MKLPHGIRLKAPSGAPGPQSGTGLARFWLAGYVGVALALLLVTLVGGYAWMSREESLAQRQLLATADAVVRDVMRRADAVRTVLGSWATDAALQKVLRAMDESGMRAKEEEMRRQLPEALGIRLVTPNQAGIMDGGGPYMSNAAIDLMDRAFHEGKVSALEVHRVGQPDMHLAIAGPVLVAQGTKALGVVHLALPLSLLPALADSGGEAGRMLYQQSAGTDVVTLPLGQARGIPADAPQAFADIPGTSLRIGVWPKPGSAFESGAAAWSAIGYLGVVGLVGLALWVPYRSLRRALAEDYAGLIALVEDGVARRPLCRLGCRLAETGEVQDAMVKRLGDIGSGRAPAAGPRELPGPPSDIQPPPGSADFDTMESAYPSAAGYVAPDAGAGQPGVADWVPAFAAGSDGLAGTATPAGGHGAVRSEIFRAYDIRGVVGQGIDEVVMRDIGHAVGSEVVQLGGASVMLARDTRGSSEALTMALMAGLRASGSDVVDLGIAPTPLLYFATRYQGDTSGVMVTASHNPPEYNGCKVVLQGQTIEGDRLRGIERRIRRRDLAEQAPGGYQQQDLAPAYIEHVERDVTVARGLKLVVDGGNGAASLLAPALYRALGCEVFELHCDLAGGFPNGQVPDPSRAENVRDLSAAVGAKGADLGLAFDGDGDRLGVVDSNGRFIAMDRVMMLFAADVLSRHPGTDVVYDVKCTHLLATEILRCGGRPVMWQSGHSRLKAKLQETGALLAGELSGHVIFQERWFGFDDAIYAGARLLELLALDPRRSAEVFATLPDTVGTPELLLPLQEGEPQRIMGQVLALADRLEGVTVKTVDGLRAEFDGGWGLVRASNTQPALSFRFQGDSQESLEMIQGLFRRLMERAAPGLTLPF